PLWRSGPPQTPLPAPQVRRADRSTLRGQARARLPRPRPPLLASRRPGEDGRVRAEAGPEVARVVFTRGDGPGREDRPRLSRRRRRDGRARPRGRGAAAARQRTAPGRKRGGGPARGRNRGPPVRRAESAAEGSPRDPLRGGDRLAVAPDRGGPAVGR